MAIYVDFYSARNVFNLELKNKEFDGAVINSEKIYRIGY